MSVIIEIHATRIQSYLLRSARLRHMRGASSMLSAAFAEVADVVASGQIEGARPVPDAPSIDGKLFVSVEDPATETVTGRLVARLRERLPALELAVSWAPASSWVELPAEVGRSHRSIPPTLLDLPVARPCDECTIDAAVTRVRIIDQERRLCADCSAREDARRSVTGNTDLPDPADLGELAGLGRSDGGRKTNHLATVYIDGNRLGAAFRLASEAGIDRSALARGIVEATQAACAAGHEAVAEDIRRHLSAQLMVSPVVRHILGGDDVLVTVPACYGTLFAKAYLQENETRLAALVAGLGWADAPTLTASGSVVVAHVKHPFSQVSEAATVLAEEAKSTYSGAVSSLAWADLTRERADHGRGAWTLQTLVGEWGALSQLAGLDAARRSRLRQLVDAEGNRAVRLEAQRIGDLDVVEPFISGDRSDLASALEMVRWWA